MQYSVVLFVTHRNAGGLQRVEHRFITGVGWICARIHEYADGNTGFEAVDDLRRVGIILHKPEGDVDPHGFRVDEVPNRMATILESRVTQTLLRLRPQRRRHEDHQNQHTYWLAATHNQFPDCNY